MEANSELNTQEQGGDSSGPVIGSVIIIVIIIVGGLYFWSRINQPVSTETPEEILGSEDESLDELQNQSGSDEVVDIEADLEGTNLNDLDQEIDNIEAELDNL